MLLAPLYILVSPLHLSVRAVATEYILAPQIQMLSTVPVALIHGITLAVSCYFSFYILYGSRNREIWRYRAQHMYVIRTYISAYYIHIVSGTYLPYHFIHCSVVLPYSTSAPILCTEHYMAFYIVYTMRASSVYHTSHYTKVFA